jgi:hypothetical protein
MLQGNKKDSTFTGEMSLMEACRDSDWMNVIKMDLRNVNYLGIWANCRVL